MGLERRLAIGAKDVDGEEGAGMHVGHEVGDGAGEDGPVEGREWAMVEGGEGADAVGSFLLFEFAGGWSVS